MKNLFYSICAICMFVAGTLSPLSAQSSKDNLKVTITKEIRQDDGSIVTETIIKEGEAAQDFDLDDYLDENEEEVTNLTIEIGSDNVVIQRNTSCRNKRSCKTTCTTNRNTSPKGFLGVSPIHDNEDRDGAVVSIVGNSSADKAGLQRRDRIVQMDDTQIDDFDDISDFMTNTKPGQEVVVTFERGTSLQTLTIPIGQKHNNDWGNWNGNNNFDFNFEDARVSKEACLGVYSSAARSTGIKGSRVSSFTDESAAEMAGLRTSDIITAVNGKEVEGHDDLWDEIAQYKAGEVVQVDYVREGQANMLSVTLNPCGGKTEQNVRINEPRQGHVISEVIVIKKIDSKPSAEREETPTIPQQTERSLNLTAYKAFPNPTDGLVNVEFEAEAQPITVSLYDLAGRQLFSEEVNSFDGFYSRQFDLSAYMTSRVVLAVQQGEKVFTEQILVSKN